MFEGAGPRARFQGAEGEGPGVCVLGGGDVGSGGGVGFREIKGASLDGGHFCKLR